MWEDFVEGEDTEGWRSEVQSGALVEIQVRAKGGGVDMEGEEPRKGFLECDPCAPTIVSTIGNACVYL